MLEIGEVIVWVEIEVYVMGCGHTSCAKGCQYMDCIIESDIQRFIAREKD